MDEKERIRQMRYNRRLTCFGCIATLILAVCLIWGVVYLIAKLIDLFA